MAQRTDIITIDGPSGVGKSTVARALADKLGYRYLDTGAMYRAVTYAALKQGLKFDPSVPVDEAKIAALLGEIRLELDEAGRVLLDGESVDPFIREKRVTSAVSAVSALKIVRAFMVKLQRRFGRSSCLVAEGRDLGSAVFPNADYKFYLDADPRARALRRTGQLQESEEKRAVSLDEIEQAQASRDRSDSERDASPLKLADDMIRIDTTNLTQDEVVNCLLSRIRGEQA
ncbi:MAG: (d)CMP kinase [Planctomycetota bacterium]|jgi:cytidylate kinase